MKKLLLLGLVALLSCATPTTTYDEPTSSGEGPKTKVEIRIPTVTGKLANFIKEELPKYCEQLGVPVPPKVILKFTDQRILRVSASGVSYVAGQYQYEGKVITIWIDNPYGVPQSWYDLKHTLLHELLHYFDDVTGAERAPADHNGLFHQRMKDLGWF